ncbi:telomere-associated protein RIF1-like [Lingula anatina]|uniref:Telomere-associated protein RIF1-like n=1 Tax=Lingula anatina TaxID=7574 RepID=A0A1S3K896_LINAN|nr:telomere-associated protein RIF1-like [Lingula anatina]|eukprot:XP_013418848.1 telomere-associated protein RIF1-like [Lingula anatina]
MMVTILDEGGGLEQLLSTINSKVARQEDRVDAYLTIMERLRQDEMGMFVKEISSHVAEMAKCLSRDIMDGNIEISQNALQVLGFCSHDDVIVGSLSQQECSIILKNLCAVLLKSADKSTCTRALWCLSKQNFHQEVVAEEIHTVLCGLEHALGGQDFQSVTVEHEAINAIVRLLEQVPMNMSKHVVRWCCLVYPLLVHPAMKVRERALVAMEMGFSYMMQHQEAILKTLIPDLKAHIVPEMRKLMASRNEVFILKVWSYFVQLLGKVLHHGSFINLMLPVIEAGFKSSSTEAKMAAFHAWDHLVENFASDPNIIGDPKRIKLVMQVFRVNNAKTEALAAVKLQSWWNFICKLGSKATAHFDQVCVPLLHFCFPGGGEIPRGGVPGTPSSRGGWFPGTMASPGVQSRIGLSSPVTPKLSLQGSGGTSPVFESLQMTGAEVLALLMDRTGQDSSLASVHYHLTPLSVDVIPGPSSFVKHGVVLISAVRDCIIEVGNKIQDSLLHQIWQSLVSHVNMMLDTTSKKDNTDIFVHFLSSFRHIVISGSLDKDSMLKCFQAVISLQSKVLGSHAYNVGDAIDMQGTPAGFLLEILFTPDQVAVFSQDERFMTIAHSLLEAGMSNTTAVLGFCQTVLGLVEKAANEISNPETVWRLWSAVVHPLMDHIQQTNEVNQGDALEHDFSCMYSALTLPVIHLFNKELPQPTMKTLLKSWEDLYRRFARLSALVTNAEANVCCEELCHKLLVIIMEDEMTPPCLDAVTHLCQVITDCVDFSSLTSVLNFGAALAVSPSKWPKRKPKPLGNIHSLVKLVGRLTTTLHGLTDSTHRQLASHPSLATSGHNLVAILSMLFTHVSTSAMIPDMIGRLAGHMAEFYRHAGKRVGCKLYNAQFMQKLEKLWSDITGCVQGRYSGPYDSHLLSTLAPLLEVTFLNSRRGIKNQTVLFWNATFARAAPLQYPESLRPILAKVKEKTSVLLPGWDSVEITVLEETPVSQMTQGESLAPLPTMPGMPSPYKVRGSFLNKPESPFKSPVKPQTPEKKESPARVRRKLEVPVQNMRDDEFVVIPPEPKKKMLLTEHQKEILREKSTLPAMYSSLDQSQDTNMFRNLYDTDSQMTSQSQMLPSQPFVPVMADLKRAVTSMVENKSNLKKSETGMSKPACDEGRRKSVRFSQQKDSEERQTAENGVSGDKSDEHMKEVGDTSNQTRPFEAVFTEVKVQESEKGLGSCEEVVELTQSQQSQSLLSTPTKMSQSPSRSRPTERNSQSPSTPRRSRSKNSKSPAKRKPVTNLKESIDKWIVKSPRKTNTEEHTKTVTLVEETQSPTKFSKRKEAQYLTVPSSESIILETPEKLDEEQNEINSNAEKASQNLFSASCENPISDTPENSCSPQSTPVKFSPLTKEKVVKLMSTPVIKIKKLTQEEIGQFNPSAKCLALSKEKTADSQEISEAVITISPPDVSSSCPQEEPKLQSVQQDEPDQEKKGRRKSGRPVKKMTKLTTNPSDESKVGQKESKKNSGVSSNNVLEPKQGETESESVEFLQASVRKSGRVRKSKSQLDEETKKRKDSEEKISEVNSLDVGGKNTMENSENKEDVNSENKEDKNSRLSDIFSSENEEMSPKLLKNSKFTDNGSQINKCEQSSGASVTEISEDKCSEPTPEQKNENMMEISQDVEYTQLEEENGSDDNDDDDEIPLASYLNNDLTSSNLSNSKNSGTNMADKEEEVAPSCGPELVCTLASDAELSENQRGKKRKRGRPKKPISQSQSSTQSGVCSGEGENDIPIWPSGQISLISKSSSVENGDDGEGAAERLLQSTLVSQSEDTGGCTPVTNQDTTQDGAVHDESSKASDLIDSGNKTSAGEDKIGAGDVDQSPENDEEKANMAESLKESEDSQIEIGRKGGKGRTVIKARNKKKAKVLERTVKKNVVTEGKISVEDRPKSSGEEIKTAEKLNQETDHKTEAEQTPELTKNSWKLPVRESTTQLKKMQATKKNSQKISKGKKEQSCTTNTVVTADKGLNVSFDSDDDVPLGLLPELQKSGDAKVADVISNPPLSSCEKDEENEPQQNSCADMFNDDKAVVQTTPPSSRKSRRPGASQEAELRKLEIDMKSPKRLRSKKSIFRRSPMNRSLGMALSIARKKKSPDQTPSKKRRKVSHGENSEETPKGEQSLPLTDSAEAPLLEEKGPDSELSNHDNLPEPGSPEPQSGSLPNSSSLQETPRSAMKPFSRSSANDLVTQRLVRTDPVKLVSFRHPTLARRKRLLLGRKREELPVAHHKEDKMEALNRSIKKAYQKDSQKNLDTENMSEARSSPPCSKMAASNGSPVSSLQALRVLQVYSPSASPSAGILKKRRLSGDSGGDSPASPPDKQRRVSFAEPIEEAENAKSGSLSPAKPVNRTLDLTKGIQFAPSPLVTTTPSKVTAAQNKFLTTPSRNGVEDQCKTSPSEEGKKFTQLTPSQNSYHSTQESQLNSHDPVYPDLVECTTPVEKLLPQLTSSMWSRGLGQLVRARNIHTVGHLCKLTEVDIQSLPIQSPKVPTVRRVLEQFETEQENRKMREGEQNRKDGEKETEKFTQMAARENEDDDESHVAPDSPKCSSPAGNKLPALEDVMENLSPKKSSIRDQLESSFEAMLESSGNIMAEITKLSQSCSQGNQEFSQSEQPDLNNAEKTQENEGPSCSQQELDSAKHILETLGTLTTEMTPEMLTWLPSDQIFTAHQHLSHLMVTVVQALKAKCQSSTFT